MLLSCHKKKADSTYGGIREGWSERKKDRKEERRGRKRGNERQRYDGEM